MGHFVSSPRECEKRDRRDIRGDEREGQRRKKKMNESEETEEIKTFPPLPIPAAKVAGRPTVSQYQLDAPVTQDTRHFCLTQPPPTPSLYLIISDKGKNRNSSRVNMFCCTEIDCNLLVLKLPCLNLHHMHVNVFVCYFIK